MKTWAKRLSFGILAASLAVWLSGCLSASYFAMVRYDQAQDEFAVMNVYQRIASPTPGDSQYLYQLWLNRDHLIRLPNIDIFSKPAYLRISGSRYADINLGEAPTSLEPKETVISLEKIRVLPGTFFLRGEETLCYYDQVVIPGAVVDQALGRVANAVAPDLTEEIDKEFKRRQDGGKVETWEKARALMLKQIHAGFAPPPPPATAPATAPENPPAEETSSAWSILDDESLKLLRQGVTDGSMKITRDKQLFTVIIPLSAADAKQLDRFWHAGVDAVGAEAAKPAENATVSPVLVSKVLTAFTIAPQPHAVEMKIDLAVVLKHFPLLSSLVEPLAKPTPDDLTKMHAAIAALTAHGVPI